MPLKQLTKMERVDIIIGAKEGDRSKIQMILESFQWLKESYYKNFIYKKNYIPKNDYYQECDVKIMKCIKKLSEPSYGKLYSLVKKSISNLTIDIIRKSKRYRNLNIFCIEEIDENKDYYREEVHNFDNQVVSDIVVYESYDNNIKPRLSPKENDIFFSHIKGEALELYAYKNDMKLETVKRIFRNAVNKIVNKEQIKKFHCIEVITLIFVKNMAVYMDLLNITDLMVK